MSKTVGIITSEESFMNNYGAALQGYALFYSIKTLGYDPYIIRYTVYRENNSILMKFRRKVSRFIRRKTLDPLIKEQNKYSVDIKRRTKYFKSFQDERMQFYNNKQMTWEEIKASPPPYDIFVCGSDQIWNPMFKDILKDKGYFLDFVHEGKKRIAYAPSIGVNEIPEYCADEMARLINKIDCLSVREKQGAQIIKKLTGRDADVLLDPTMLLSKVDWDKVAKMPDGVPDKYILCYRFADSKHTKNIIEEISKRCKLPVITLPLSLVSYADNFEKVFAAGPSEFVALIKNAQLVCTDSFHASIFSILMDTPFLTFLRENLGSGSFNMNSRVVDLLETLQLTSRLITPDKEVNYSSIFDVGYAVSKQIIEEKKSAAIKYLKNALDE